MDVVNRRGGNQPLSFLTRAARRETLREPVFLWITPFVTPRIICGSAAFSAAAAASRLPAESASSTLRTAVRIWLFRFLLMAVLRAVLRTRFSAETWLGIGADPELEVGKRGAIDEFRWLVQRSGLCAKTQSNFGFRFSTNAAIPSFCSGVANRA